MSLVDDFRLGPEKEKGKGREWGKGMKEKEKR